MKKILTIKCVGTFLVILLQGSNLLLAQNFYEIKHKIEFTHCGSSLQNLTYADMLVFEYYLDGKQIPLSGAVYSVGKHDFRVVIKEKNPIEGMVRSFEIKEIRLMALHKDPIHDHRAEIHSLFGKDVKLALTIGPLSSDYLGYALIISINRCDDGTPEPDAMVKVITSISSGPGERESPVSNIYVQIGDQVVPIDEEGVGWIKIRPAQYKMTYYRNSQIYTGTSEPGTVKLKSTKLGTTQPLASAPRKNDESKIESNVPLLKENTGSGNLYDYELRINMIGFAGTVNQVRVVAVQPDVQVHKAGTPEDNWITVTKDMVFLQGDEISVDPEGAVTLQFADGSTTVVKTTSQLKIASYFTEGGVVRTEILLKMGEIAYKVHKSEATKSDFRIKAPTGTTSRRGTIFSQSYNPTTKTNIIKVEEGLVDFIPTNTSLPSVTLQAGQQLETNATGVGKLTPFTGKIDFSTKE